MVVFIFQVAFIILLFVLYGFLILFLFRKFLKEFSLSVLLLAPLLIFSIGFVLRLSGNKPAVDLGFFFTDFTLLFIYALFTATLLLGQIKYWKK